MKIKQEPKRLGHNSKNIIDVPGNDNTLGEDIIEYILNLSGPLLSIISEAEDKHKAIQGEPYYFENELCKETNLHGVERKLTSQGLRELGAAHSAAALRRTPGQVARAAGRRGHLHQSFLVMEDAVTLSISGQIVSLRGSSNSISCMNPCHRCSFITVRARLIR